MTSQKSLEALISSEKQLQKRFQEMRPEEGAAYDAKNVLVYHITNESDLMASNMAGLIQSLEREKIPNRHWLDSMTKSYQITDEPNFDEFYAEISKYYPKIKIYVDHLLSQYEDLTNYIRQCLEE